MRLRPATRVTNKHLLTVYDKPMIYYSLSTLLLAGVQDIAIVVNRRDLPALTDLLGDGSHLGASISYRIQANPRGIVDGILACSDLFSDRCVIVALGDNLFHGPGLGRHLQTIVPRDGARILTSAVSDARDYGVVELSDSGVPLRLVEKPTVALPGLAVVGLYFYGPDLMQVAHELQPSPRGELEITDLNQIYLASGRLSIEPLPRGTYWQDLGSPEALYAGSEYVRLLQRRTGLYVGCPEEISWRSGWIDDDSLLMIANSLGESAYGKYLAGLLAEPRELAVATS